MLADEDGLLENDVDQVFVQQHLVLLASALDLAVAHRALEIEAAQVVAAVIEQILHDEHEAVEVATAGRVLDRDLEQAEHLGDDRGKVVEEVLVDEREVVGRELEEGADLDLRERLEDEAVIERLEEERLGLATLGIPLQAPRHGLNKAVRHTTFPAHGIERLGKEDLARSPNTPVLEHVLDVRVGFVPQVVFDVCLF